MLGVPGAARLYPSQAIVGIAIVNALIMRCITVFDSSFV